MIPPGLWAAFSMIGCVLSCLSDARHTGMCLICALLLKKCLAVCLTECLMLDARRGGFVPVYRLFDSKKACPVL